MEDSFKAAEKERVKCKEYKTRHVIFCLLPSKQNLVTSTITNTIAIVTIATSTLHLLCVCFDMLKSALLGLIAGLEVRYTKDGLFQIC